MALSIVSIPIGNPQDITIRALEALRNCEVLIVEEAKAARAALKAYELQRKPMEELNEHSSAEKIQELLHQIRYKEACLISDCGTPVFCDPGAKLIAACRKANIPTTSLPGASSLMCLLSQSALALNHFYFHGFLPKKTEDRKSFWKQLSKSQTPTILMDTPYRFQKSLEEIIQYIPNQKILLAINATLQEEKYIECTGKQLKSYNLPQKAEFIFAVYPTNTAE